MALVFGEKTGMIYISHRGNIIGSVSGKDNNPDYVEKALRSGYDVEVDVWGISDRFLLGHDYPTYRIEPGFLTREKIWCHAKNPRAIVELKKLGAHFFWHGNDDYTLTSRGFVWTYPGKALTTVLRNGILPHHSVRVHPCLSTSVRVSPYPSIPRPDRTGQGTHIARPSPGGPDGKYG